MLKSNFAKSISENLTVIVPAYNEEEHITETVKSIKNQTTPPKKIFVVDDISTDKTGSIAEDLNVQVLRPPKNTGSKAGAQNFALESVKTEYCMAVDADTVLSPDAIEKLSSAMMDEKVAAACGFVVPRHISTVFERGRYIEYLIAFTFYKPIQDYFEKPLISSGCFSLYKTDILKKYGGWSTKTMAEDMDLTWLLYEKKHKVRFVPEAVCYPVEPNNLYFMAKQLKRWSHGFVQNVMLHKKALVKVPYLRLAVRVAFIDALLGSLIFLFFIPLLFIIFFNPLFLLAYVIDAPVILVIVMVKAKKRNELKKALASFPSFFLLRVINSYFMLEAIIFEILLKKPLTLYEKGH